MNKHSRRFRHDVQGRILGIPYDFRWPTFGKIASRVANPRSGMISPKVWGWGWTLNLAHPGSWAILGGAMLLAALAVAVLPCLS
ncbi:MAG: hypothetical protein JRH11_00075 [Deltaproteobacteria bacterium]|nr:hypothetical protein [Deltaproteobacteria bacterium]